MTITLTRDVVIDFATHPAGTTVELDNHAADFLIKTGNATPASDAPTGEQEVIEE